MTKKKKTVAKLVRFDARLHERIVRAAVKRGVSRETIIRECVERVLK